MEIWKDVVGTDGAYSVSNLGNVKRIKSARGAVPGRVLKPYVNKYGYHFVGLFGRNNVAIHKIVAEAFLDKPDHYETINHKNGIKSDNRPENLEFMSRSENTRHSMNELGNSRRGKSNPNSKLTEDEVLLIRSLNTSMTHDQIAELFGVSRPTITEVLLRRKWKWL